MVGQKLTTVTQGFFIMAGPDQDGAQASPFAAFDINCFIADEKRPAAIDNDSFIEIIGYRLLYHAGSGLATVQEAVELRIGIIGMRWAIVAAII